MLLSPVSLPGRLLFVGALALVAACGRRHALSVPGGPVDAVSPEVGGSDGGVDPPVDAEPTTPDASASDASVSPTPDGAGADSGCGGSRCLEAPTLLRPAPAKCATIHLTLLDDMLYWSDTAAGAVWKMPLAHPFPTIVADGEDRPGQVLVWGNTVYWTTGPTSGRTIGTAIRSTSGGFALTPAKVPEGLYGFTVAYGRPEDGLLLFYGTETTVERVSLAGGPSATVVAKTAYGPLSGLAVVGTTLVGLDPIAGKIFFVPDASTTTDAICGLRDATGTLTGPCRALASDNGSLLGDALPTERTFAYWADGASLLRHDFSKDAPDTTSVAQVAGAVRVLAIDDRASALFVASESDTPTPEGDVDLDRFALADDAKAIPVAHHVVAPVSLAANSDVVVWSTADCRIFSARR
jgi:hypothetical protein